MTAMTPRRFDWVLRTRGPVLAEWPERDRAAALDLLRHDKAAQQMLADSLSAETPPAPDMAARCRMQAKLRRALAPAAPLLRGMRWGALVVCAATGLYLGLAPLEADSIPGLGPSIQAAYPETVLATLEP